MPIVIDGYADSDKVPGFYGETKFGASGINIGSIPLILLLVGLKGTSGGTITVDVDVKDVTSREEADTYVAAGSEAARMCYRAFDQGLGGVKLKVACPAPAGGAAAATATITLTGTTTSAGTEDYYVGGEKVSVNIPSGTAQNAAAALVQAEFAKYPRLIAEATVSTNVVTLTIRSAGARGNQAILFQDTSKAPAGLTSAIAGGAAVTGGGVKFTGGVGVETMTTLLALLYPARYHRIAVAQNDATSLAAWETQIDSKAGVLEGRMEHVVVASNDTYSNTLSLAQTTLNNARFQMMWLLNSETHPSEIAAAMAAVRASAEQTSPNSGYDDKKLINIAPQRARGDWSNRTTQQNCLDNGITPLRTTEEGEVQVVRSITTRSLDGSTPDYRTLDTSEAVVPDYCRDRYRLVWTTEFKVANKFVAPDPATGEKDRPPGVATPTRWALRVLEENIKMENELILTQTRLAENQPKAEFNYAAKRIMSVAPVIPLSIQHALGVSVRQGQPIAA